MIVLGSRYQSSEIGYVLNGRSGVPRATVAPPPLQVYEDGYDVWFWRDGDRLDLLAEQFYGKSTEWWRLLDANPEIVDPAILAPGTRVRIPR